MRRTLLAAFAIGCAQIGPYIASPAPAVILSPQAPRATFGGTLVAPGNGKHRFMVTTIDLSAFRRGGKVTFEISLADGKSNASFDLFAVEAPIPTEGSGPPGSLAGKHDVRRGTSVSFEYSFTPGAVVHFGASGNWFSPQGTTNQYQVIVSAVENR
jgi:hypothetical protein